MWFVITRFNCFCYIWSWCRLSQKHWMNIESTQRVKVSIVLLLFGRSCHVGLVWLRVTQKTINHYHWSTNRHLPQAQKINLVYRQVFSRDNHDFVIHARRKRKDRRNGYSRLFFFYVDLLPDQTTCCQTLISRLSHTSCIPSLKLAVLWLVLDTFWLIFNSDTWKTWFPVDL